MAFQARLHHRAPLLVCALLGATGISTLVSGAVSVVDNTSSAGSVSGSFSANRGFARPFTMDSTAYTLDSISVRFRGYGPGGKLSVQIWSDDSDTPGTLIEDLGVISSTSIATVTKDSTDNPTLAANTKYWVVVLHFQNYPGIPTSAGASGTAATIHDMSAYQTSNNGATWTALSGADRNLLAFGITGTEVAAETSVSSIVRVGSTPSNGSSVQWTVIFADSVMGVTASNFSLVDGSSSLTGETISGVSGSGTTWTVTASTGTGDGTLGLNFANDTGLSLATSNEPFTGEVYTIDKTAPTISIGSPSSSSVIASSGTDVTYTITYSDNVGVNAITLADGNVTENTSGTGGTATVSGSGTATRTVTVGSITGVGTLGISIAAGTASDAAGNLAAAAGPSTTFSVVTPEIDVHDGATTSDTSIANNGSATSIGTTTYGTAITKTYNIANDGNSPLNVSLTTMPANFSLSGAFPTTIAASSSATFTVQLDADSVGSHSGNIVIDTDDVDEDPFTFGVSGTVNKASPTITITSDDTDPSTYQQTYTVTVSVAGAGAGVTPTGTVTLDDGDGNNSTITLAGGTGSVVVTPAGAGVKTLSATYNGDANYLTDNDTESHTVNKATPTVTITSDNPDANNVHDDVTVTFTVVAPHGGTPTGNVIVSDDTGVTTTVDVSTGTATLDCMPVGSRTITAAYQGDSNFNAASDTEVHTVIGPDITVSGNAIDIADGDTSPTTADDTDYGNSGSYPYVVTKTYTIFNAGTDTLNLTGPSPVTLTGADTGPYTIVQPASLVLAPFASTTFTITFAPEIAGAMDAVVHIASDDKIKPDFDYAITGMIIPSAIDTTYNPGIGPNRKVSDVAVQDDGKAVIVGAFITYNNISRKYVARVAVDGSLDTTFDPGTGATHQINSVDIHTEGKILIGGRFTSFNGTTIGRVARLNTDGSLDTSFQTTGGGSRW